MKNKLKQESVKKIEVDKKLDTYLTWLNDTGRLTREEHLKLIELTNSYCVVCSTLDNNLNG